MKINKILSQHRRDFYAEMECEGCGHIDSKVYGYDDENFHHNVIPNKKCIKCNQSSNSLGVEYRPLTTKYPADKVV